MENTILQEASQVKDQVAQTDNSALTDDARNIALAMSLASRDRSIAETPEMKELMSMIDKGAKAPEKKAPTKTPAFEEETSTELNASNEGEAPKEAKAPAKEATKDKTEKSIFFSKETPSETTHDLTTMEGIKAFVQENYGTDNVQQAFNKAIETSEYAEKVKELEKHNEEVQEFLVNLPEELYDSMEAYHQGRDWKAALSKATSKVNFTKAYEQNNEQDIVNHYFPNDFNADDFADKSNNDVLQKAINIAKRSFERDASIAAQEKANIAREIQEKTAAVKESVETSIKNLKKTFPEISENAVKKIHKAMVTGDYKSIFFNADGTFTKEAAKSIALALYGDQEIRKSAKGAARQESNKVVEDIITRGADKPKNTAKNTDVVTKQEDNSFMKLIGGYLPSNNTYSANQ